MHHGHALALMSLAACTRYAPPPREPSARAPCLSLEPHPGLGNHNNPYELAVDVAARRLYSSSLGNRTLGIYDADSAEVLAMVPIRDLPQLLPDVVADGSGVAWVLGEGQPAVVRFDAGGGGRQQYAAPLTRAGAGVPLAGGGVLVLGSDEAGHPLLQRFEADGQIGGSLLLDGHAHGLVPLEGGEVGVLTKAWESDGMRLLEPEGLSWRGSCPLPFEAMRGAQLDDGTVVLASERAIGLAGCQGQEPVSWSVGVENKDVISLGVEAVVLDRIAEGDGLDPNLGLARIVDGGGLIVERSFPTAKNSGFGAWDSQRGLLWVNSEGSGELVAYEPGTGTERARIETGTFLDGLALDPEDQQAVYLTGRLSNSFLRLDQGQLTASTDAVRWPFSPVPDPERDMVWVLSQTEGTVHGHRRGDLSPVTRIDPGLAPNVLLSFGSLALHPERDTLLFAESQADLLIELDPTTGEELGRHRLGGPFIDDPDEIGHLAVVAPAGSSALLLRTNDGRVQRLDLDSGALVTAWLDPAELAGATADNQVDIEWLREDLGLLYVAGLALEVESLARRPDRDLPVSRLLGVHPDGAGHLLGVSPDRLSLLELNAEGRILGQQPFTDRSQHALSFGLATDPASILVAMGQDARVCWFGLDRLRD
jgi:hypothetical protein